MSGDTDIEVQPQTPYNFQFLISSAAVDIVLVRALDVSWVKTIQLSARIHRANIGGNSAKYEYILFGVNPSATDGQEFLTAAIATSTAIVTGAVAGSLITWAAGPPADPANPFVRLILRATGPTIATPGNLYAELSASLALRGP